ERELRVAPAELLGQPGQAGAERERLHPAPAPEQAVDEEQDRARVRLHRPGDVAENDQLAVGLEPGTEGALDGVAAGRERGADEPAQVERRPARMAAQTARSTARAGSGELRDQPPQ